MASYDAQMNPMYYPASPRSSAKKAIGMTMIGGLIGMNAYYLPVKKDVFVQKAFDITKEEATEQINTLKTIAEEVEKKKVSTPSKMILTDMALPEDVTAISNKCSEIEKKVTDPEAVKTLKDSFSKNFENYKKNAALMDNNCAEAFRSIKWGKFRWGMGIGAAIGLALSLMSDK